MTTATKTDKPELDLPAPSDEPAHIWAEIRGRKYKFTELEIGDYDRCVTQATTQETDPESGLEIDVVDNALLMRLMLPKVVSPKPPAEWLKTGTRMYRAMASIVNELHFGIEPVKILGPEGEPLVESKDEPKGNE